MLSHREFSTFRYAANPDSQLGIGSPTSFSYGDKSNTLHAGRCAACGRIFFQSALLPGVSAAGVTPNSFMICCVKPNQLVWPELLRCQTPLPPLSRTFSVASARSKVYVGEPTWSSTTASGLPALAAPRIVCTKFLPCGP